MPPAAHLLTHPHTRNAHHHSSNRPVTSVLT